MIRVFADRGLCLALLVAGIGVLSTPPLYPNHADLSYYLNPEGVRVPIRTPADWEHRRADILAGMEEVMGPLPRPKAPVPLDIQVIEEHRGDGYIRRKLAYHTDDPTRRVRAWLLLPINDASKSAALKRAAILCLQQTTKNGKDSPVGLTDRPTLHYALELAKRGYVTLSPDYPSFGESSDYDFDADTYPSGSMKAVYDNTRAVDVLQSLPEVDANRIGCIGHSLGGHNGLFTAAFEPRIKAVVTSCGFTSFRKYKNGDLTGWSGPRYMPLIAARYNNSPEKMPFDFPEVLAAIAPRAIFIVSPLHDDNFDNSGVRDCLSAAQPIFKLLGHPENLQAVHPDAEHDFPDAERKQSYEFLATALKSQAN
jgi:pimeloyl-ACP methyl ester carboxylesterase